MNDNQNKLRQNIHDIKKQIDFVFSDRKKTIAFKENILKKSANNYIHEKENDIRFMEKTAGFLDPKNVLERGYTLTYKNGKIQKRRKGLKENDVLTTRFADGKVKSKIEK